MAIKQLYIGLFLLLTLSAFTQDMPKEDYLENNAFMEGEFLEFKAKYGFFTVGKGSWKVKKGTVEIHNRPTYQVDVIGRTSGFVNFVAPVDDLWRSYVDTANLVTHMAQRNLIEGKYKKIDITEFFHSDSLIKVSDFNFDKGSFKPPTVYEMQDVARGMISGFMYMRTMDFNTIAIGDTISFKAFLDDTFYDFQVICYNREVVETKAGDFKSVVFRPVMPDNSIFEGEDSILAWISDDENKIPLKVEAEMFVGHAGIELTSFRGLRNNPALVDD
jgi:hypothetical protein